jgi:hypothetical protein
MGGLDYCIAQLRVSAFVLLPAVPVRNYDIPPCECLSTGAVAQARNEVNDRPPHKARSPDAWCSCK